MSRPNHALYISDQYLACSDVNNDGLDLRFSLSLEEKGSGEKFKDFLNSDSFGLFSVFIDVMGTEIKQEHVPHVTGKDRELLLDRKSQSIFPAADLVWKEHIKREKTGRKDDIFLFIGISLSPILKHILEVLGQSKNKVKGIYSISALQQKLSKGLPTFSQSLVISRVLENNKKSKSFRQSFYRDGKLVISRVNNVTGAYSGSNEYDQLFIEVERTYQFLQSAKLLAGHSSLKVISLLTKKESALLFSHQAHVDIDFSYASFDEVSKNLGLKLSKPCGSLPEILGNLAVFKNLEPHFKPIELCESYRVETVKKSLILGSVMAVVLSIAVSSWLWYEGRGIKNSNENLKANIVIDDERKRLLVKGVPETDVLPKAMKQTIDLYDRIVARGHKPEQVLEVISRAYEGYQDLEIRNIVWQEEAEKIDDEDRTGFFMDQLNRPKQVHVTIRPSHLLNNRAVLERVDGFKASLSGQPEIKTVEQAKSAIDVRSSAKLEETFGREQEINKVTEFTLVITL